jgi:hypothetical protein
MAYVSFSEADSICDRFLALLKKLAINPPVGSRLEDDLLSVTQLVAVIKNPNLARGAQEMRTIRTAAGLYDFAAKILAIEPISEFQAFVPHLTLIGRSKLPKEIDEPSVIQMSKTLDDTGRKMAELYLGSLVAHLGTDVVLDSPSNAKGDNPDVLFRCQQAGTFKTKQWALAIKTISTSAGQTIFERIKEAANQIDAPQCTAEAGLIIINAKNALRHQELWDAEFGDEMAAERALFDQIMQLISNAEDLRPQAEWDDLFNGKVVRPILFLGQSVVRLPTSQGGPYTPVPLKMLINHHAYGAPDPTGFSIAYFMNEFMQRILHGIPGRAGQLPQ